MLTTILLSLVLHAPALPEANATVEASALAASFLADPPKRPNANPPGGVKPPKRPNAPPQPPVAPGKRRPKAPHGGVPVPGTRPGKGDGNKKP